MSDLPRLLRARAAGVFALKADAEAMEAAAAAVEATDAKLAAIEALHRKVYRLVEGDEFITCPTCDEDSFSAWPCDTYRIIHPEETA